ncbi:hypothetical protein M419DRAFT_120050 [Trichoderma reesei RUT C-30]|uniref:Uncharacterized protein n=1 Tax=Hypocrea jecorina (strain ATCC 56765 / BCRC 32924 / NRRL 11460 / Rut C-30) TaxID=1344414 RepID=A0A024S5R8_HYPJR|nr:hypothetical protein M419DRAFT_120050 [Trichoderma reesei RUT C-30]
MSPCQRQHGTEGDLMTRDQTSKVSFEEEVVIVPSFPHLVHRYQQRTSRSRNNGRSNTRDSREADILTG